MPSLRVTGSDGESEVVEFEADTFNIGRSDQNDLVLRDPVLSRRHAQLFRVEGAWLVRDCSSRNGTILNGSRLVVPGALRPGDEIRVGRSLLLFEPDQSAGNRVVFSDEQISTENTVLIDSSRGGVVEAPGEQARMWLEFIEIANRELLVHQPVADLYPKILDLVFRTVLPERVAIFDMSPDGRLECKAYRGRGSARSVQVPSSIARRVVEGKVSMLVPDADIDVKRTASMTGIRSIMAAPLLTHGAVSGLIYADSSRLADRFNEKGLRALTMLANIVAMQIHNAGLIQEQIQKQRFEQEAKAAAEIQERLLQTEFDPIPGYDLRCFSVSCFEVGGDYYDGVSLDGDRFALALGDVAGKGMGAAMLMAVMMATFRAHTRTGIEMGKLVAYLNATVLANAPRNRFVTFFLAELDHGTHRLRYVNAGHAPQPLIVDANGEMRRLPASSMPLGIQSAIDCRPRELELAPGDTLFVCTDGVTDTVDPDGEMFGDERLHEELRAAAGLPATEILRKIEAALEAHSRGASQPDDLTVAILTRSAS